MAHEQANDQMSARQSMGPKVGEPMMKQPTFNWGMEDKYNKLENFRLEVNNVFQLYTMPDIEKTAIIKVGWAEKDDNY